MRDAACRVPARGLVVALFCLGTSIGTAHATSVLVPDDYPTIQQAIDSGADTVVVREGRYEEDLVAGTHVVALLAAHEELPSIGQYFPEVVVGGLDADDGIFAKGIRFTGPVSLGGNVWSYCTFEGCRFDGLFTIKAGTPSLFVRGCLFFEDLDIRPWTMEIVNSSFVGAHLDGWFEGYTTLVGNVFVGPGDFAIKLYANNGGACIVGNTIMGKVEGIIVEPPSGTEVRDNEIRDCSGTAFRSESEGPYAIYFVGNRVKNCGGHGFEVIGPWASFLDNVVDSVGGDGIRAENSISHLIRDNTIRHTGGRGIVAAHASGLGGNQVVDTGSDGIVCGYVARADSNVIGRAGGKGLWVTGASDSRLLRNTVYACTGDGIRVEYAWPSTDSLTANIAYANGGAGLVVAGPGTAVLTCNDWQANSGGATVGIAPGPTDLAIDPLFCNVVEDDVSLTSASPLLNAPGCGQIGALGQGCEISISGPFGATPAADRFRAFPHPALDRVTFAWPAGAPARLEVFDVTGARRWQADSPAGAAELSWNLTGSDGARLPAGVYWARLTHDGAVMHSRVVRIR